MTVAAPPMKTDMLSLFLNAEPEVMAVIIGLILASVATWAIIVAHSIKMRKIGAASEKFEREFWKADEIDGFYKIHKDSDLPTARVFSAGMYEWRRSTGRAVIDRDGTRARLATSMGAAIAGEVDRLGDRLNILATVGSIAPFVGLLGTVLGIMRSFTAIAGQQNTSLAVVAPGIAEALFATAIGLFAAIPAVIAYNRFGHGLNRYEARLNRFADGFHATLSRELELAK